MKYLKLIGYRQLILIAAVQISIKYFFFEPFQIDITLSDFGIFLLVFGTLCLAAAGNCISAINNWEAENAFVGKSISEKTAYTFFLVLNSIGVGIGFYLSNLIGHPGFSALAIIISALLYLKSITLKKYMIVDNFVSGIMAAMLIVVMGLYELLPAITPENRETQRTIFSILLDYALLGFVLTWLREMVQDQRNINGDHKAGNSTLSVALGKMRTNKLILGFACIPLIMVIYYMYNYLFGNQAIVLYVLILVVAPLLYFIVKIPSAETQKNYKLLWRLLTFVMWTSLFSIGLYQFILL